MQLRLKQKPSALSAHARGHSHLSTSGATNLCAPAYDCNVGARYEDIRLAQRQLVVCLWHLHQPFVSIETIGTKMLTDNA